MPLQPTPPSTRAALARSGATLVLSLLAAATIVACQPAVAPAAAEPPPAPPPAVTVAAVERRSVEPSYSQVGRVEAAQRVEIRPRVAGHIEAALFREGDVVRAGQPLFRIDPRPFDVVVERARADLRLAMARESLAQGEARRARELAREEAISAEEVERRSAAHAEAAARTAAARAVLASAELDREFAVIRAPLTGRIGRALVTAGNYVSAGSGQPPLATLTATAPLHVYFDVGDSEPIDRVARDRRQRPQARILDPQTGAPLATAPVDFVDNEMNAGTGTLRMRARIAKPPAGLLPGQFVRVELAGVPSPVLLVPETAIATDQGRHVVLVIDADQQVAYRPVQLGPRHGDARVVSAGVQEGERVIVSGLMRVRPGMAVTPQPAATPSQAQSEPPRRG